MSKKKISVTIEQELDELINRKAKQLGISKSAFVAFSANYFLRQLENMEKTTGTVNVYSLIRQNLEG